jgi:hypothetical protein
MYAPSAPAAPAGCRDDLLAEAVGKFLREQAAQLVGRAASVDRDDEAQRLAG